MPMPFDATLKDLVHSYLPDFERQFNLTALAPLRPLNVDLSTVSAATDMALAHGDPPTGIVDLNFQASRDDGLVDRVLLYNTLLHHRRAPKDIADRVFEGVRSMRESTTYQGILEEGRVEEARRMILRVGRKKLGRPSAAVHKAINGIADLDRLEHMGERLVTANHWEEVVGASQPN
jgi:hypothetical protein